ncbi:unnamed protein product, partial [Didymodactylos carnosus]
MLWRNEFRKI